MAQLVSADHGLDDGPCLAGQHQAPRAGKKSSAIDELADLTVPEVRRLLAIALPLPVRSPEVRLAWSLFRRRKRWGARQSHYRRRPLRRRSPPTSHPPLSLPFPTSRPLPQLL